MLGIKDISVYLPQGRQSNLDLMAGFDIDETFLAQKIGVRRRATRGEGEDTSDMALKALEQLIQQQSLAREQIQALVVVTQNPDTNLPHVSGLVHARAGLMADCATFDISLGCSGYVYGLSLLQSFLAANGLTTGVLITCDPYSKIIDPEDKGTVLLFGDAATATLIDHEPIYTCGPFQFGTQGDVTGVLVCRAGRLHMNGREVFNFAATVVPRNIIRLLERVGSKVQDMDCYIFHQGSRFIVETIAKRLVLDTAKVRMGMEEIGNTVSSSIPILLQQELGNQDAKRVVLCGFGVGLSWASCICERVGK